MLNDYFKLIFSDLFTNIFGYRGDFRQLKNLTTLTFDNELPDDVCIAFANKIDQICATGDKYHWTDPQGSDERIFLFERFIESYLPLLDIEKKIIDIQKYTGRKIKTWTLMANKVTCTSNNLGSGGGFHRDSPISHQIKCIWYLSDTFDEQGPFEFVPNSNINIYSNKEKIGKYRYTETNFSTKRVLGKKGTLIVCDTRCIHRGSPIIKGTRYAITLYTFYDEAGKNNLLESFSN